MGKLREFLLLCVMCSRTDRLVYSWIYGVEDRKLIFVWIRPFLMQNTLKRADSMRFLVLVLNLQASHESTAWRDLKIAKDY